MNGDIDIIKMATKDWKTTYNSKHIIIYENRLFTSKNYLTTLSVHKYISKNTYKWSVAINNKMKKSFKTKSAALKFAKSYMRKH